MKLRIALLCMAALVALPPPAKAVQSSNICWTDNDGVLRCDAIPITAPDAQELPAVTIVGTKTNLTIMEWIYRFLIENDRNNPGFRDTGGGAFGDPAGAEVANKNTDPCNESAPGEIGNPILPATGTKREVEIDFATQGEMALYLQRTYNSFGLPGTMFAGRWRTNFEMSLHVGSDVITAYRNDGSRIDLPRPSTQTAPIAIRSSTPTSQTASTPSSTPIHSARKPPIATRITAWSAPPARLPRTAPRPTASSLTTRRAASKSSPTSKGT